MPSIKYAHVCEYARVDANGTVSIIGIFTAIQVANLPVNFPLVHVITCLTGQRGETFQFQSRIAAPDGKVLQAAPVTNVTIPHEDSSANQINGYVGLTLPVQGIYSVELLINHTVVHTIPFRVVQKPSNA